MWNIEDTFLSYPTSLHTALCWGTLGKEEARTLRSTFLLAVKCWNLYRNNMSVLWIFSKTLKNKLSSVSNSYAETWISQILYCSKISSKCIFWYIHLAVPRFSLSLVKKWWSSVIISLCLMKRTSVWHFKSLIL